MNCHYCQRPCRKCKGEYPIMFSYYWKCDYHGAVQVRHYNFTRATIKRSDEPADMIGLVVPHNNQIYQAVFIFNPRDQTPPFPMKSPFYVERLGNKVADIVTTLDFHPDLTPDNILNKIRTYLVFS